MIFAIDSFLFPLFKGREREKERERERKKNSVAKLKPH